MNIAFSNDSIHELTICVFSILQNTMYIRGNIEGKIELFQGKGNTLGLCTVEPNTDYPYVVFSTLKVKGFQKTYSAGLISDPVIAVRENKTLRLRTNDQEYVL